jgi:hypothetical protein
MSVRLLGNALAVAMTGLVLAGCQPATGPPNADAQTTFDFTQGNGGNAPAGAPTSPDEIVSTDPTAARLQDVGGYVLLYYRDHQQMPATLDELRNMPGGQDLQFTSASTGKPFVYQPAGMWSPQRGDKCIILYDPDLKHGARWCLFMTPPKAGAALSVDVAAIPEPIFLNYQAAQ